MDYTVTPTRILSATMQANAYGNNVHSAMGFRLPGLFYEQPYAYGTITIAFVCVCLPMISEPTNNLP